MNYKLTATFKNGKTVTKKSKKDFGFAWYSENIYQSAYGFASNEEGATKAARAAFTGCPPAHTIYVTSTQKCLLIRV